MTSTASSSSGNSSTCTPFEVKPRSTGLESLRKLLNGFCGEGFLPHADFLDTKQSSKAGLAKSSDCPSTAKDDGRRGEALQVACPEPHTASGRSITSSFSDDMTPTSASPSQQTISGDQNNNNNKAGADNPSDTSSQVCESEKAEIVGRETEEESMENMTDDGGKHRWRRIIEVTFVTISIVLATFLTVQWVDGDVSLKLYHREPESVMGIHRQGAIETEMAGSAQSLIDVKDIVEDNLAKDIVEENALDENLHAGDKKELNRSDGMEGNAAKDGSIMPSTINDDNLHNGDKQQVDHSDDMEEDGTINDENLHNGDKQQVDHSEDMEEEGAINDENLHDGDKQQVDHLGEMEEEGAINDENLHDGDIQQVDHADDMEGVDEKILVDDIMRVDHPDGMGDDSATDAFTRPTAINDDNLQDNDMNRADDLDSMEDESTTDDSIRPSAIKDENLQEDRERLDHAYSIEDANNAYEEHGIGEQFGTGQDEL